MKIGIHHTKKTFSERWIAYCESEGINYKIVDCYANDIISQLSDCDALMWHFNHKSPKDSKFARQLLFALQDAGKLVFPDFHTMWHFDDKVAQKYLLEGFSAPLAPSYVFYDKKSAINWAGNTSFPKVFKLRTGAGSNNVQLVSSFRQAHRIINRAFGKGYKQYDAIGSLKERYRKFRQGKAPFFEVIKGIIRIFHTTEYSRVTGKEMGYVYFQDFIPDNDSDIRIIVVGNKAFAIKRLVRKNDFRASGSGFILYEKENFDKKTIQLAFKITEKMKAQCMAYDFVFLDGKPMIVEVSFGFAMEGYDPCTGYWDKNLNWHEGKINPYAWMVEDLINRIIRHQNVQIQE